MPSIHPYTLTDIWGRTIEADGAGNYWLPDWSIWINLPATNDAAALSSFNSMEPAADYVSPE